MSVKILYAGLSTDEMRGTTQTDYLVAIDGDLRILDGGRVVYEETSFPVVELARELSHWVDHPPHHDFEFDSMSFEEQGAVAVRKSQGGWVVSSTFDPNSASVPVPWNEVKQCVLEFVCQVKDDLRALKIDPHDALQ